MQHSTFSLKSQGSYDIETQSFGLSPPKIQKAKKKMKVDTKNIREDTKNGNKLKKRVGIYDISNAKKNQILENQNKMLGTITQQGRRKAISKETSINLLDLLGDQLQSATSQVTTPGSVDNYLFVNQVNNPARKLTTQEELSSENSD